MSLWCADQPLVLASKSASRRAVLEGAGIPLEVRPADIDERAIEAQADTVEPGDIAALLAREKALAMSRQLSGRHVLGADQTLALGRRLFTKPVDIAAARDQLRTLRGTTHVLHSAVAVARDGEVAFAYREVARMTMRSFSDAYLEDYLAVAGDAVTASVGAYQVERIGIQLFDRIDGDRFTILGLPVIPLLDYLRKTGCLAT
jgi:septum formation protein